MAQYHLMLGDASADYSLCNTQLIKQLHENGLYKTEMLKRIIMDCWLIRLKTNMPCTSSATHKSCTVIQESDEKAMESKFDCHWKTIKTYVGMEMSPPFSKIKKYESTHTHKLKNGGLFLLY